MTSPSSYKSPSVTTPAAKAEGEPSKRLARPSTAEPEKSRKHFFAKLGPGLITGASDDDPSGIATYSQVGAQFGYGLLWTMLLSYPLMAAIQEISARIGRVTGWPCGESSKKLPKTGPLLRADCDDGGKCL